MSRKGEPESVVRGGLRAGEYDLSLGFAQLLAGELDAALLRER